MKKRRLITVILVISAFTILLGSTAFAYMFRKTDPEVNQLVPAQVSCSVREVTDEDVKEKTSIKIENTGNIDSYLRVRFISYWVKENSSGDFEIVGKPSVIPVIDMADGWIAGPNNTYYYQTPVAPAAFTGELLKSPITLTEEDGYKQVIEVFAEAIQSKPDDAVENSWNVGLDSNGKIISVN